MTGIEGGKEEGGEESRGWEKKGRKGRRLSKLE